MEGISKIINDVLKCVMVFIHTAAECGQAISRAAAGIYSEGVGGNIFTEGTWRFTQKP